MDAIQAGQSNLNSMSLRALSSSSPSDAPACPRLARLLDQRPQGDQLQTSPLRLGHQARQQRPRLSIHSSLPRHPRESGGPASFETAGFLLLRE